MPTEDRGSAFGVVIAPEGATLDYTDRYMRQIEEILLPLPERQALFTATGLGFGGPGRVTNVASFGAFVDVGVHQDGLVHVSQIANHYVQDPSDELHVGQSVTVRVLEVDRQRRRIALTIKGV